MIKKNISAVILAAGSGSRMNSSVTKQRLSILGESVLLRSVRAFERCDCIGSIVVVCREDEIEWAKCELNGLEKIFALIPGGKSRAESAKKGFEAIPTEAELVLIHDAARCLVTPEIIESVVSAAIKSGAATAVTAVNDTVKQANSSREITATLPRSEIFLAQTPQAFQTELYKRALSAAETLDGVTDDNMLLEDIGVTVSLVECGKNNIKITTPEDVCLAEYLLGRRASVPEFRVGHGYDVHRFADGRELVLGGVLIPYKRGLLGHSDADVLVHAIMDSLLGAAGLGDIGRHFPDTSAELKDISSLVLLCRVGEMLRDSGYNIANIDATLVIQAPKISPYIYLMVENIAKVLKIDESKVNIKATTEEGLGFTGESEGASAHSVAMIIK